MANKQHAQFSDENGNIFYLENETEDVLDPSGKPLSNGGDLSEASVTFTPDATRKLPQSGGRFKAFLGSIVKFLSDLTEVAFTGNYSDLEGKPTIPPLANNCTTTAAGYGLDARQGKVLMDKANQLSSDLGGLSFGQDAEGNWGYIPSGADAVIPFSSGFKAVIHGRYTTNRWTAPNDGKISIQAIENTFIESGTITYTLKLQVNDVDADIITKTLSSGDQYPFHVFENVSVKQGDTVRLINQISAGRTYHLYGVIV